MLKIVKSNQGVVCIHSPLTVLRKKYKRLNVGLNVEPTSKSLNILLNWERCLEQF